MDQIELRCQLSGPSDPPEYSWLYGVPAVVFTGGFLAAASTGMAGLVQAGYLTSSILCIGSSVSLTLPITHLAHRLLTFRRTIWSWIPGYSTSRKCAGHSRGQLWHFGISWRCRLSHGSSCPVRGCGSYGRRNWHYDWKKDNGD
jgi:hypothetical protein